MRLTYKDKYNKWCSDGSKASLQLGNPSENWPSLLWGDAIDKLATYEDAEEQGRLVMLPCKVGDTVFRVVPKCIGPYIHCPFEGGPGLDRCYNCDAFIREELFDLCMFEDFGKTVFLTREEAEAALKRR